MMQLTKGRPADAAARAPREQRCYDFLQALDIAYERVDHAPADTMELCAEIDEVLQAMICKNLFLCNRQQTQFYLLLIPEDKTFKTKDISHQLGVARLSFGSAAKSRGFPVHRRRPPRQRASGSGAVFCALHRRKPRRKARAFQHCRGRLRRHDPAAAKLRFLKPSSFFALLFCQKVCYTPN